MWDKRWGMCGSRAFGSRQPLPGLQVCKASLVPIPSCFDLDDVQGKSEREGGERKGKIEGRRESRRACPISQCNQAVQSRGSGFPGLIRYIHLRLPLSAVYQTASSFSQVQLTACVPPVPPTKYHGMAIPSDCIHALHCTAPHRTARIPCELCHGLIPNLELAVLLCPRNQRQRVAQQAPEAAFSGITPPPLPLHIGFSSCRSRLAFFTGGDPPLPSIRTC